MVHLFDLCLWFGLVDTAWALALRGVEGCMLEDHHLGPFCRDSRVGLALRCHCQGWDTCAYCCWAFPVDQGIWMEDWDGALLDSDDEADEDFGAIPAAQKAVATPVTRAILDICSRDIEVPFSGSAKAMARFLDIAILTGNRKAAVNLAKKCQLRPLRRWKMDWVVDECWQAARTALWAGADFEDLMVKFWFLGSEEGVPFPQAMFLKSKLEDWQEIRHLLPGCHGLWMPQSSGNRLGEFFLEGPHGPGVGRNLSLDKIRAAGGAGLDLQLFSLYCEDDANWWAFVTLLDMAVWCGQPDCAEACVDGGIELMGDDTTLAWHKRVLRRESLSLRFPHLNLDLDVVPFEAQTAAAVAGCAWLKRLWKSESSQKGIVLYQMMLKMFKGRPFPMALVQDVLTLSMPVPKILDQLDLWEHVGDWTATICGRPASVHPAADYNTADVEETEGMQDNDEAGRLPFI